MAEDTELLTSVNSVFSRIKMALSVDGIYSAKGSAVPPTSFLGGMYSSKDDERLDSTHEVIIPVTTKNANIFWNPTKGRCSSFIMQFERMAIHHSWSEVKKLDRLLSSSSKF